MKEIELSKTGKNKGKYKAFVDADVFDIVNEYDWSYSLGYAIRSDCSSGKKKNIRLHRYIWNLKYGEIPEELDVDHKDQNKLNCCLSNLRLATRSQNNRNKSKRKDNTSGFIGVSKYASENECQDGIHFHKYWKCSWNDNLGKRRAKTFSFDNVGKVRAARYFDLMAKQFGESYTGELNFQSLAEYQHTLKQAILKDIESN